MGKIFRRTAAAVVHAEVQSYTGVGEYYMSDFETPNTAQQRAKQRAEQNACEKADVFVKSFSQAKNFELVEGIIETMTSGILKIVDVKFHRENFDNIQTMQMPGSGAAPLILGEVLYYRGLCYQAAGNNAKAQADFDKAKELGYNG